MTRSSAIRVVIALVRSEWSSRLPKGWVWDGLHPYLWIQDVTSERKFSLTPDATLARVLEICFATMMPATLGRTFQERTRWTKMASDVHVFRDILTHVCITISQWKSDCFSAACPLWLFQLCSRQPKLNLLHRTLPGALMWFTAPMRSNPEETNCLTKPSKAWSGCCLFIKESCHTVASFFDSRGCFLAQNACTEATNSSAAIPMSQWKCVHTYESMKNRWFLGSLSAVTLVMFVILAFVCCCEEAREPKRNLLQSLTKPSKAWTGCYELICCKARWRSVLEETICLAKPSRAWAGDVFPSKNHVPLLWLLLLSRECDSRFRFLLRGGIFFCFRATISRHKYK